MPMNPKILTERQPHKDTITCPRNDFSQGIKERDLSPIGRVGAPDLVDRGSQFIADLGRHVEHLTSEFGLYHV